MALPSCGRIFFPGTVVAAPRLAWARFLLTDAIAVTGLIAVDFKGDIGIPWFFGSQKDIEGFPYSNFSVRYKIESQVCKSHSSSSIEYEYPNGQAELVPYESLKTIAYTGQ